MRSATTSVDGIVQLSDSTGTTSSVLAATPTAVKAAYDLADAALPKAGGTVTGDITLGTNVGIQFEGTTDDANEIRLIGADATADRTITLPNVTGTVVTTGDTASVSNAMLATISTAGKVSNSATTADSANTASAIVARDASGNFAAGDITIGDKIIHASDTDTAIRFPAADTVSVETIGTERMRINNVGNLLIGTTVALNPSTTTDSGFRCTQGGAVTISRPAGPPLALQRTDTVGNVIIFYRDTTTVGTISVTASATAYNTSSDYRLKENITLLDGAIARLNQLPVHRFNFIADPDTVVDGFIAHEAAAVVPECVTGEKDEVDEDGDPVYQGIDQSKVVPLLTAALQEAIAMIGALEARVAALELN